MLHKLKVWDICRLQYIDQYNLLLTPRGFQINRMRSEILTHTNYMEQNKMLSIRGLNKSWKNRKANSIWSQPLCCYSAVWWDASPQFLTLWWQTNVAAFVWHCRSSIYSWPSFGLCCLNGLCNCSYNIVFPKLVPRQTSCSLQRLREQLSQTL